MPSNLRVPHPPPHDQRCSGLQRQYIASVGDSGPPERRPLAGAVVFLRKCRQRNGCSARGAASVAVCIGRSNHPVANFSATPPPPSPISWLGSDPRG